MRLAAVALSLLVGFEVWEARAGDSPLSLQTFTSTERTVRSLPAGSAVTFATDFGGTTPPQVRIDAAAPGNAEPVIVELHGLPLVRRVQGRSTRAAKAERDAMAAEHRRAVDEILRLGGIRARGGSREFQVVFNGIAAVLTPAAQSALRGHPDVKAIHPDPEVKAILDSSVDYVRAPAFWTQHGGYRGAGRVIAVIDTGVDYTHPDLGACSAVGGACKVRGGYDFENGDADPVDDNGHGTHVAATAAGNGSLLGVAPDASLLAYKVLDAYGSGLTSNVIAGIEAAVDPNGDLDTSDHADVINLSLGGPGDPDDPGAQAVDAATTAGVLVVAAAGNSGGYYSIGSPGVARTALTVGAVSEDGVPPGFTSGGPIAVSFDLKPEISAPGVFICAARADGTQLGDTCLDDGHIAIDGTSMATPHVAGAAALLRGVLPALAPDEVKSLLAQNGKASDQDALQVGASILDVARAATVHTVVSPQTLSFGLDDLSQTVWSANRTLTVRNIGTTTRSYSFSATGHFWGLPAGATVSFEPARVSLSPGQSTTITVTLSVDNAVVPNQDYPPNAYEAMIKLRSGGETQRVPMIFVKTPLLRVHTDQVATLILAHDGTDPYRARAVFPTGTTTDLLLAAGAYDVVALFPLGLGTFVVHEGVVVTGHRDETMNTTEAVHTVTLAAKNELGGALSGAIRSFSLYHRASAIGMATLTSDTVGPFSLAASPIGSGYDLDLAVLAQAGAKSYVVTKGLAGVSADEALTNAPADLTRGSFRYYANPGEIPTGMIEFLSFMVGPSLGFGLGPPAVSPVDRDLWITPAPHGTTRHFLQPTVALGGAVPGAHNCPWYRGSTAAGVIQAFNALDPDDPVYETSTGELPLDLGPASFFARFVNGDSWVNLVAVAAAWTWTFHSPGGDGPQATDGTVGYRLLSNGNVTASGVMPQSGFGGPFLPFIFPLPARPYVFESDPLAYWIGGLRATARIAASFDTRRYPADVSPPYLRRVEVRSGGALVEVVPTGSQATVRLEVHDGVDATVVPTLARSVGGLEMEVPLVALGAGVFEATIPGACDAPGTVDLVVSASDAAGNELREWLTPGFVCRGAACGNAALDPGEACDDGNLVSGDGCNANCSSTEACGDGVLDAGESCDDGNTLAGDCCSAACAVETAGAACNDGRFCNGADTCDGLGACSRHGTDPCAGGPECASFCDEGAEVCGLAPAGTTCSDDGNACTDDACDGAGGCAHVPNVAPCDDGVFCNGADTCVGGACSVHAGDPCAGGGECADRCEEAFDSCFSFDGCSDDGEMCTLDVCNGAGTCIHVAAYPGLVCRPSSEECDVAEVCDHIDTACPADSGVTDSDGDGVCDGLDPCTNVGGAQNLVAPPVPKLVLGNIFTEPTVGNDTMQVAGTFLLPATTAFWQLFPLGGVGRVVLLDGLGVMRADVMLPNEFYSRATKRGWAQARNGKAWTYRDETDAPLGGIARLVVRAVGAFDQPGGRVKLTVVGKKGSFPITDTDLPANVIVTLGDQSAAAVGRCAESTFAGADCRFNGPRTQVICRRTIP
jgi:cysteine-rich repeat protein